MATPQSTYPEGAQKPSFQGVQAAYKRIQNLVHVTPILSSKTLDKLASSQFEGVTTKNGKKVKVEVALKAENLQKIGAFKARGALSALTKFLEENEDEASPLTVFTHSSGNHAGGVAFACQSMSTPERPITATIIMPSNASEAKKAAVRTYGGTVIECSPDAKARKEACDQAMEKVAREGGRVLFINSYDDVNVIHGQGTVLLQAYEEQLSNGLWRDSWKDGPDVIMTPLGGGGLLSGTSLTAKAVYPKAKIVGAEPEGANDAAQGFKSGTWHPALNPTHTVADGLLTALGFLTFPTILKNVDHIFTAPDCSIILAMRFVWERMKVIVEPSGCLPLAVLLGDALGGPKENSGAGWKDLVLDIAENKEANEKEDTVVVKVFAVFSGGNCEFKKIFEMFESLESS